MMNIRINHKEYTVPELGFKDMVYIEDMGFSVLDLFQKQKFFSLAVAFTAVCVGCGKEEAEKICEQHVLGGGSLEELCQQIMKLVEESGFFKKLLRGTQKNQEKEDAPTENK